MAAGGDLRLEFLGEEHAGELSEIARGIWMECYPPMIGFDAAKAIFEDWQSPEAIRRQMAEGYQYSFVMSGGVRAGYCCVRMVGDRMHLSKMYVDAAHRGTGLGSAMIRLMMEYGRSAGAREAFLHVNKKNAQAIRAYEACGFRITKSRVEPFGNGIVIDDYIMEHRYV